MGEDVTLSRLGRFLYGDLSQHCSVKQARILWFGFGRKSFEGKSNSFQKRFRKNKYFKDDLPLH